MYLLISLLILIVSFCLFKIGYGSMSLRKIHMGSYIFYFHLVIQSFIGSILAVYGIDNHYAIGKIPLSHSARLYGWLAVMYTMIALPIGILMANKLVLRKISIGNLFKRYTSSPVETYLSKKDSYIRYSLYLLTFFSFLAITYTFISLKNIPFLALLSGEESSALAQIRIKATREFPGIVHFRNIFGITLTPILAYIAYSYYFMTKSKKDFIWFLFLLFSSLFILSYNLAKAPILFFLLGFIFLSVLLKGKIKYKTLIAIGLLIFLLLTLMYIKIAGFELSSLLNLFLNYNSGITGRLILSQIAGLFLSFYYFPRIHPFIGWSSLSRSLASALNLEYSERSARIVMTLFNPSGVLTGKAGVMNSLFVAEAWANFGLIGVLLAPLWVGFLIQLIYVLFLKFKKTPIYLGILTFLSFSWPITGGFNDFIYSPSLVFILGTLVLIIYTSNALKKIKLQEVK